MIKNRAIIITGASKRLGFKIALESLNMGYDVIIHYRNSKEEIMDWIKMHPEYEKRILFVKEDLSSMPEKLIEKAIRLSNNLVGLVNNASLFSQGNLLNIDHFKGIININFFVPAILSTTFYKKIKKGWIINISDAGIKTPNEKWQNYRMSKIFLEELTRQMAFLFAPNMRVNAIALGPVLPAENEDKKAFQKLCRKLPLRKKISIDSFLKAYNFLVENQSCTGEIINVDSGWHLL